MRKQNLCVCLLCFSRLIVQTFSQVCHKVQSYYKHTVGEIIRNTQPCIKHSQKGILYEFGNSGGRCKLS